MTIHVNTIVKNEEKWLWYSVASIVDHIDKILLWDTGSTDNTPDIIRELQRKYPDKIFIKEVGDVNPSKFSKIRQQMLSESSCDWVLVLDGDEIWWEDSISKIIEEINRDECDAIVSPFINVIGDIFHYQEEAAGKYRIDGITGNITIRGFRKGIKGLHLSKDYGQEGFVDNSGEFIQESGEVKRKFIDEPFLHLTHLRRSSKDNEVMQRELKLKHELGVPFPKDFYYPEVFFKPKPAIVESPWGVMSKQFKFRAFFETPLRKVKRRLWYGKVGY